MKEIIADSFPRQNQTDCIHALSRNLQTGLLNLSLTADKISPELFCPEDVSPILKGYPEDWQKNRIYFIIGE